MKTRDYRKNDYLWNSVAGMINASEAVIMSIIVTRLGILSDAGILSLAFAVGNVLMTIGKFGGRMYQVTDINRKYTLRMYLIHRVCSIGLMIISLVGFLLFSKYEANKAKCIILIAIIYMIETMEDCFWGHYQLSNRLYIGAQMFSVRWVSILTIFTIFMIIRHDMLYALLWGTIASAIVFCFEILLIRKEGDSKAEQKDCYAKQWLIDLFRDTFPLFLAGFCSIFISNIPKFAIDRYMNDEVQACYGFVAMPVFVIGLLNQFIYQPIVVRLTDEYYAGSISKFKSDVKRQMIIVLGISCICICGAALLGIPILSFIYHTDLSNYWRELVILQFAGGFLALSGFFIVLLTLMRKQKIILFGYLIALIAGIILISILVRATGTLGASLGYMFVMAGLFAYYFFFYQRIMRSHAERGRDVSSV